MRHAPKRHLSPMYDPRCLKCGVFIEPDKKRDNFKNRKYCSKTCQGKAAQERYWRKKLSITGNPGKSTNPSIPGEAGPEDVRP